MMKGVRKIKEKIVTGKLRVGTPKYHLGCRWVGEALASLSKGRLKSPLPRLSEALRAGIKHQVPKLKSQTLVGFEARKVRGNIICLTPQTSNLKHVWWGSIVPIASGILGSASGSTVKRSPTIP